MRGTGLFGKGARFLAMTILTALLLGACGSGAAGTPRSEEAVGEPESAETASAEAAADAEAVSEAADAETTSKESPEEAPLQEIYDAIAEEVTLPGMYFADDSFLMNYYGIDASLLDDYLFASCEDAARVDTVILMRVRDESDAQTVKDGLQVLLDQMEVEMDNYLPEAHALVKAGEIRQNGRFLDLVLSGDREAILAVIDRMTK